MHPEITTDLELSSKLLLKNAAPCKQKNMVMGILVFAFTTTKKTLETLI